MEKTNKTSMLHIRVKPDVKKKAEKILDNKTPKFKENMTESIAEAEKMEKNPEKMKKYHTVEELMEALNE